MMNEDRFKSIKDASFGIYKERGSRFISVAIPVRDRTEVSQALEKIKKDHPKARHHCYAYRLGPEGRDFRAYDDGEPSGTAGRPILGQIDAYSLSDVLVVITRYFGGKLLGASGLIQAYRASANDALQNAKVIWCEVRSSYRISFDYGCMGTLMKAIRQSGARIESQDMSADPSVVISLPKSHPEAVVDQLIATTLGKYIGEIKGGRHFEELKIRAMTE